LANDRIAVVIEDAGDSDLYDPWGGRPVGFALVDGGAMVSPSEFGEIFILAGRYTFFTDRVSVISDGSDGTAVVRATGRPLPLPFIEPLLSGLFNYDLSDTYAAVDYALPADSNQVSVTIRFRSQREDAVTVEPVLHAFMYTERLDTFVKGAGFGQGGRAGDYLALVSPTGTSIGYQVPGERLASGLEQSGFLAKFADSYDVAACGETEVPHAILTVAGPGLQGLQKALAEADGTTLRTITGVVRDSGGTGQGGVRVHALSRDGEYLTRTTTAEDGSYSLAVDPSLTVDLFAFRRGDGPVGPVAAGSDSVDLALPAGGLIHVIASELDGPTNLPVRVQVLPTGDDLYSPPREFGEKKIEDNRLHVEWAVTGDVTMRAPVGSWEVVVSRGYEYELFRETVDVTADATVEVEAVLERSVDTTGFMCADYHIHTYRSPDSGDDSREKVMSAIADGLEIPVRSDHEYVNSFEGEIAELGVEDWAFPVGSIEMTSFEAWGHMGVFPLTRDEDLPNGGATKWIDFPDESDPDREVTLRSPIEVFDEYRARPDEPAIIINHPRGGQNYFSYVGLDPISGLVDNEADWDTTFTLVEVFNDSGWIKNRETIVADWLALLNTGRRIYAVGSSDSHGIAKSPTGYPRTCLDVGVDTTADLSTSLIRDATFGGNSVIDGGVFLTVGIGGAGPGEDATGTQLDIKVQAPTWVDVDTIEVLVDGQVVQTITILPEDADPIDAANRWEDTVTISPQAGGSHVIVAAYQSSGGNLSPVHPGRRPFGVSNPIFVTP
ncbi:MAG: CehA/McbA family metallohydrolase, partial [Deltaproteobacteria bacterium]|nr:CehA/McbA family metallohydrolase [Deltaproteobacteria bacterium]